MEVPQSNAAQGLQGGDPGHLVVESLHDQPISIRKQVLLHFGALAGNLHGHAGQGSRLDFLVNIGSLQPADCGHVYVGHVCVEDAAHGGCHP
mmetsp:Transcript_12762/g.6339  ORF Transcript_12762/g.6339 Transcript_12762/m.6339 type:complete len:92 (+) Transcript_12762:328-603(+)